MIDIKMSCKRAAATGAVLTSVGLGVGLTPAIAQAAAIGPVSHPATVARSSTSGASVYSDQWEDGYRGFVSGGVIMICWADGAWANGTNRWFDVYAGAISGFVNANLVSGQAKVKPCP
jgi:hypothetical protein